MFSVSPVIHIASIPSMVSIAGCKLRNNMAVRCTCTMPWRQGRTSHDASDLPLSCWLFVPVQPVSRKSVQNKPPAKGTNSARHGCQTVPAESATFGRCGRYYLAGKAHDQRSRSDKSDTILAPYARSPQMELSKRIWRCTAYHISLHGYGMDMTTKPSRRSEASHQAGRCR